MGRGLEPIASGNVNFANLIFMENEARKVDCNFYEELELLSLRHKRCRIVFFNDGARSEIIDEIRDIYTREAREWLKAGSGLEIALDQLLEVDGKRPSWAC